MCTDFHDNSSNLQRGISWLTTLQLAHGHRRKCNWQKCLAGDSTFLYIIWLTLFLCSLMIYFICISGLLKDCVDIVSFPVIRPNTTKQPQPKSKKWQSVLNEGSYITTGLILMLNIHYARTTTGEGWAYHQCRGRSHISTPHTNKCAGIYFTCVLCVCPCGQYNSSVHYLTSSASSVQHSLLQLLCTLFAKGFPWGYPWPAWCHHLAGGRTAFVHSDSPYV